VKGQHEFLYDVKITSHGPVINGIVESLSAKDSWVAMDWQLLRADNLAFQSFYQLNHAKSYIEAKQAISMMSAPGFNFMYADVAGNIAWWAAARLPIRKNPSSKFFLDASTGMDDYNGYYAFTKNPQSLNPTNGFVYSSNNQPDTVQGNYFPGYYYPRDRAGRVAKLLSEEKAWTLDEVKNVNLDVISNQAAKVAKEISSVLDANQNSDFVPLTSILIDWDGNHRLQDIGPSVYYNMLSQIVYMAMADEIGYEAVNSIASISIMKNSYLMLLSHDSSAWWDDVRTKEVKENRADIFLKAARKTLALLKKTSGTDPSDWTWNKIHTLKHKHPLGVVELLDKFFSVGPLEVPGGNEVINNLHFELDTTGYFPVTGGPALRKITDFADLENGETASPTGQSGNVMSEFYSDQAEMFAKGQFRKMLTRREDVEKVMKGKLLIKSRQ
jgi:penicillin amidase